MRHPSIFCKCGLSMTSIQAPDDETYQKIKAMVLRGHEGEGHGPATAQEAARARRRAERERGAE